MLEWVGADINIGVGPLYMTYEYRDDQWMGSILNTYDSNKNIQFVLYKYINALTKNIFS